MARIAHHAAVICASMIATIAVTSAVIPTAALAVEPNPAVGGVDSNGVRITGF